MGEAMKFKIMDASNGNEGALERTRAKIEEAATVMGDLANMLVAKGLINRKDVETHMTYFEVVED